MRARKIAVALALVLGCDAPGSAPPPPRDPPRAGAFPTRKADPIPSAATAAPPPDPEPTASAPPEIAPAPPDAFADDLDPADQKRIDAAVQGAIQRGEIPGAVVLLIAKDRVVFHRAYGLRAKEPEPRPMTRDTVFDLASLTKPLATAASIAWLAERGKLRFTDPVARHLPAFAANDKQTITIEQLLLHTSGLPADNSLSDYAGDRDASLSKICAIGLTTPPGEAFRYSDLGFIVLGEIVRRAASKDLDVFTRDHLYSPLGMRDTTFSPPPALIHRTAPTERLGDHILLGHVHDPRARALGEVAGHAGLFSTALDLSRFARMLFHGGALSGARVLSDSTVRALLSPRDIPGGKRAYFGSLIGEAVTHTGFTGTSFWLEPRRKLAVILLSNRVHPDGKGTADRLRRDTLEAAVSAAARVRDTPPVQTGIDALESTGYAALSGRKIALLTHAAGRTRAGRSTIDALRSAPGVTLVSLLAPEHGLRSSAEGTVSDTRDPTTGLHIHSLYSTEKRPTKAMLEGADTLVIDLQDAGVRFYTYETTVGYALEAAAALHVRVVLLDRPNPLGGVLISGPGLDEKHASFVAYHDIPLVHGMTLGELARLFNSERKLGADLTIIPMKGYKRASRYPDTGLSWTPPSPNLRTPTAALVYPGVGLLELTNLSVGRGTPRPFEQLGAPYIDSGALQKALTSAAIPGVTFQKATFTPTSGPFANQPCRGVTLTVTDPSILDPVRLGLTLAVTLRRLYPQTWDPSGLLTLLGHDRTYEAITTGKPLDDVIAGHAPDTTRFSARRKPYLLY